MWRAIVDGPSRAEREAGQSYSECCPIHLVGISAQSMLYVCTTELQFIDRLCASVSFLSFICCNLCYASASLDIGIFMYRWLVLGAAKLSLHTALAVY